MPYKHRECGGLFEPLDRLPPDPDRWGNLSFAYRCERCGKRESTLWVAQTRSTESPPSMIEIDDRGVPLEEVCG